MKKDGVIARFIRAIHTMDPPDEPEDDREEVTRGEDAVSLRATKGSAAILS